jgi:leader peptidase (prepilin peptidase)/N-methyltransferase
MTRLAGGGPLDPSAMGWLLAMCAFFAFIFGVSIGSFLNVCIYRMPLYGRSPWKPSVSFCFTCGSTLRWHDNLPLVSYLWLMGRCRRCGAVYSSRYFWIELFCGLLYLALFIHFGPSISFLNSAILGSLLVVVVFTDLDEFIIPDEISLGGMGIGLALSGVAWLGRETPLVAGLPVTHPVTALLGALVGGGILWLIGWVAAMVLRREAMGLGDVKLLGMMGMFLGPVNMILTIFLASCLGAVFGLSQKLALTLLGRRKYAHIPFGPWLAVAGFATLFAGPWIVDLLLPPESLAILKESLSGR